MKKIKIVVDVSTESEKWFCENDGYIQSNLAIDIVKGCIKSVLGPYPKFLVLPQGVF